MPRTAGTRAERIRCAVYTRKSSDEGLDQEFNSLHAQREACEAFIASQRHEGWHVLAAHYNDGGYSGGTMDRPALKRLLGDIAAGKVDIVVVYKIDRLTRSLFDFAKIVEAFEAKGVSFVSVTQAFNTTTSMGRLTLNVLLSFAQFEREVASERIRDKIAASKRKGMWMGGAVPLGYDAIDRKLKVNPEEAKTVRLLFELYLKLGSVRRLHSECQRRGFRTKPRTMLAGDPGEPPLVTGTSISFFPIRSISAAFPTRAAAMRASMRPSSTLRLGRKSKPNSLPTPAVSAAGPAPSTRAYSQASCSRQRAFLLRRPMRSTMEGGTGTMSSGR